MTETQLGIQDDYRINEIEDYKMSGAEASGFGYLIFNLLIISTK